MTPVGPLSVICPVCRMIPGVRCENANGIETRGHRDRLEAAYPMVKIARLTRELGNAQRKCDRAATARVKLPAGSSRARVTSANARWATAAEARDRIAVQLEAARAAVKARETT